MRKEGTQDMTGGLNSCSHGGKHALRPHFITMNAQNAIMCTQNTAVCFDSFIKTK